MQTIKQKNLTTLTFFTLLTAGLLFVAGESILPKSALSKSEDKVFVAQNSSVINAKSAQQETLYLNNDRTYSYNLVAKETGTINDVEIPVGATIVGKYVPAEGGLRYVAEAVTYDGQSHSISASSETIEDVKDPRDTSAGSVAKDAGIGAAGGVVLGEVLGDAGATEIIGGAAAGAATGNLTADRVVVIEPDSAIALYE